MLSAFEKVRLENIEARLAQLEKRLIFPQIPKPFEPASELKPFEPAPEPKPFEPNVHVGSRWRHYNGCEYTVMTVANIRSSDHKKYPVTIVYLGINGRFWTRPLGDWHRSMTLIEEKTE